MNPEKAIRYLSYLQRLQSRQTALDLCNEALLQEVQVTIPKILACLEKTDARVFNKAS